MVKGQSTVIVVADYDQMIFKDMVLAAGPVAKSNPEMKVNGEMLFDYERSVWFFRNVTITYAMDANPHNCHSREYPRLACRTA